MLVLVKAPDAPEVDDFPVVMYATVLLLKVYFANNLSPDMVVWSESLSVKTALECPQPRVIAPNGTVIPYVFLLSAELPLSFIDIVSAPKNNLAAPKS